MNKQRILREENKGLCILTLNRPDKLNAIDTQTFDELTEHCADLEQKTDSIGCVILQAEGRAFSAGADLGAIGVRADGSPVDPRYKPSVIERLASLPQPTIAAIHGACFTGGLELALACDFLLADSNARFADTHGKWGFVGEWGMMQRLPRRIGTPAARRMMMTGEILTAEEAARISLIDELVPLGELHTSARAFAMKILANSWHTNFAIKRTLRETDGMSLAQALSYENYHRIGPSPDSAERVARFSKR